MRRRRSWTCFRRHRTDKNATYSSPQTRATPREHHPQQPTVSSRRRRRSRSLQQKRPLILCFFFVFHRALFFLLAVPFPCTSPPPSLGQSGLSQTNQPQPAVARLTPVALSGRQCWPCGFIRCRSTSHNHRAHSMFPTPPGHIPRTAAVYKPCPRYWNSCTHYQMLAYTTSHHHTLPPKHITASLSRL